MDEGKEIRNCRENGDPEPTGKGLSHQKPSGLLYVHKHRRILVASNRHNPSLEKANLTNAGLPNHSTSRME